MSVTKQGKGKAWSLASPQIAPPVTVPAIWPSILHAAILTHHKAWKKVHFADSLLKPQTYFNLVQKQGKKKKRKNLLVKKQKWEEKFTGILDWQNQGTGTMPTDFRLLKWFCYLLFTWMWCAALFLTQNYWQHGKKKKNSSCTLIKPLSYPGRGENV